MSVYDVTMNVETESVYNTSLADYCLCKQAVSYTHLDVYKRQVYNKMSVGVQQTTPICDGRIR